MKKVNDSEAEKRIAYEVSVSKLELLSGDYDSMKAEEDMYTNATID